MLTSKAKAMEVHLGAEASGTSNLLKANPKAFINPSTSFRMSFAFAASHSYEGDLTDIASKASTLVTTIVGNGWLRSAMYFTIFTNILSNLSMAWVTSAMVICFFGDAQTDATPQELGAGLLLLSIGIAAEAMVRNLVLSHIGSWFIRRAKFAISLQPVSLSVDAEADIMGHLSATRQVFLNNWANTTATWFTEIAALLLIAVFSPVLTAVALLLCLFSKTFAVLDDLYLIAEQNKFNDIKRSGSTASQHSEEVEYEATNRFLHNNNSGHAVVIKLAHVLYSHVSPVIFFVVAAACSIDTIPLSCAMSSVIFYLLAAKCHLTSHGTTTHVIRNLYHAERILVFDSLPELENGGGKERVFKCLEGNNTHDEIPFSSTKNSSFLTATHSEKAGIVFTSVAIATMAIGSFVMFGSVDMSCQPIDVTCGHIPTDGSTVVVAIDTVWKAQRGCTLSKSIEETLTLCSSALLLTENGADEDTEFSFLDYEAPDLQFEAEEIQSMQSAANAPPLSQSEVVTVAAKYSSWSGIQQFTQTLYQPFTDNDAEASGDRRLTSTTSTEYYGPVITGKPLDSGNLASTDTRNYEIIITVGSKRSDDSNDEITVKFVGSAGFTDFIALGKGWTRGEVRKLTVSSSIDVGNLNSLLFSSGGKNGLMLDSIVVDNTYVMRGPMATMVKCRGSKRQGTYNCEKFVNLASYRVEVSIGSGRYDGSPNNFGITLVGHAGEVSGNLGGDWTNEIRTVDLPRTVEIGTLSMAKVTSSGTNGLKITKLVVDETYSNTVASELNLMVKCSGSKSTWATSCVREVTLGSSDPFAVSGDETACRQECDESLQGDPVDPNIVAPLSKAASLLTGASHTEELKYSFGSVWNRCDVNGPVRFHYQNKCDQGCAERAHSFKLSPLIFFEGNTDKQDGVSCQQKNGKSYPKYCADPDYYKDGKPWSMEGLSTTKQKQLCPVTKYRLAHDRGHQIPANAFDGNKDTCEATNYMTNIQPQAAKMNRGAWLKTEMMVECWRNEKPTTVVGGAVFIGDGPEGGRLVADIPAWEGIDRSDWFMPSHNVKNPAYFWKVIVTAAVPDSPIAEYRVQKHIAFWMPNHDSARAKFIDHYIVSLEELESKLARWGAGEVFGLEGNKGAKSDSVWADPRGCNRM